MRPREFLAIVADILQVIGWFGFSFAVLYGGVMTWGGWKLEVPWFWILLAVPFAMLAVLGAWAWIRSFGNPPTRFDLNQWTNHETYPVWVAACLWINRRPWPVITPESPAFAALQKIKSALETGLIAAHSGTGDMKSRVLRQELIKLANHYGEKPPFLFPPPNRNR